MEIGAKRRWGLAGGACSLSAVWRIRARFYAMLRELDAELVGVFEYPDHHAYTNADWQAIVNAMRDTDLVITTEKDLVKLERFPFPRDSLYALRLEVTMDAADARALDELIPARMTACGECGGRIDVTNRVAWRISAMALSQELLDILACPKCKGDLHLNDKQDGLVCSACKLEYPVRDDIPIMLIEEAKPIA